MMMMSSLAVIKKASVVSRSLLVQRLRHVVPARLFSNSDNSYYDSQSGLHVPVHDETNVKVFLNLNRSRKTAHNGTSATTPNFTIPPQLYKESYSDMPNQLRELQQQGIHGLILPSAQLPRDHRNLTTLWNILSGNAAFQLFSYSSLSEQLRHTASTIPTQPQKEQLTVVLHYTHEDTKDTFFETNLQWHAKGGIHTTIALGRECFLEDVEAVVMANKIASFMDAASSSGSGAGQFIWLSNSNNATAGQEQVEEDIDADHVVRLCEELMYLDLPGATVKSRLMVDASLNSEVVDETMMLGVNKFVVEAEDQVEMVREIAEEQGKTLLLVGSSSE